MCFQWDEWDGSIERTGNKYTGRAPHFGLISKEKIEEETCGMNMAFSTKKLQPWISWDCEIEEMAD